MLILFFAVCRNLCVKQAGCRPRFFRKNAGLPNVGHAVLCAVTVRLRAGRGEHHLRRRISHRIEKRIRREVFGPVRAAGRDPANWPRRDDCVERIVLQAVTVLGAIKYGSGLPLICA